MGICRYSAHSYRESTKSFLLPAKYFVKNHKSNCMSPRCKVIIYEWKKKINAANSLVSTFGNQTIACGLTLARQKIYSQSLDQLPDLTTIQKLLLER